MSYRFPVTAKAHTLLLPYSPKCFLGFRRSSTHGLNLFAIILDSGLKSIHQCKWAVSFWTGRIVCIGHAHYNVLRL